MKSSAESTLEATPTSLDQLYEAYLLSGEKLFKKLEFKIEEAAHAHYDNQSFLSPAQKEARVRDEIQKELAVLRENLIEIDWSVGLKKIQQKAKESGHFALKPWLIFSESLTSLNIDAMLSSGFSLISSEAIEAAYAIAVEEMDRNDYTNAKHLLITLIFFSPKIYELWTALGICQLYLKKYQKSFLTFVYAAALKPELSSSYWYCAFALQHERQYGESEKFIEKARQAKENNTSQSFITQVLNNQKSF